MFYRHLLIWILSIHNFRDKRQMSSEYIIEPIQGMEAIQKNFADLSNNGNEAAKNLVESKKVLKPL